MLLCTYPRLIVSTNSYIIVVGSSLYSCRFNLYSDNTILLPYLSLKNHQGKKFRCCISLACKIFFLRDKSLNKHISFFLCMLIMLLFLKSSRRKEADKNIELSNIIVTEKVDNYKFFICQIQSSDKPCNSTYIHSAQKCSEPWKFDTFYLHCSVYLGFLCSRSSFPAFWYCDLRTTSCILIAFLRMALLDNKFVSRTADILTQLLFLPGSFQTGQT